MLRFVIPATMLALLASCTTVPPKTSGPPAPDPSAFGKYYKDDGPPETVPDNLASIPDAVPRDEPFHKWANRPYTVFGEVAQAASRTAARNAMAILNWRRAACGSRSTSGSRTRPGWRATPCRRS